METKILLIPRQIESFWHTWEFLIFSVSPLDRHYFLLSCHPWIIDVLKISLILTITFSHSGDVETNTKVCQMILQKIMEDPQSGSCLNLSYADVAGPVANFNPTGSPYATKSGKYVISLRGGGRQLFLSTLEKSLKCYLFHLCGCTFVEMTN